MASPEAAACQVFEVRHLSTPEVVTAEVEGPRVMAPP